MDIEDTGETTPSIEQVPFTPKTIAAFIDLTRKIRQQSSISIENFIMSELVDSLALGSDYAAMFGTGANGNQEVFSTNRR